jgi:hypothetical protein
MRHSMPRSPDPNIFEMLNPHFFNSVGAHIWTTTQIAVRIFIVTSGGGAGWGGGGVGGGVGQFYRLYNMLCEHCFLSAGQLYTVRNASRR